LKVRKIIKGIKIFFYAFLSYRSVSRSGLFDVYYYKERSGLQAFCAKSVVLFHYLFIGYRNNLAPGPFIVPENYYSQISFSETDRVEPIYHYLKIGWKEGINPHPLFENVLIKDAYIESRSKFNNPAGWYLSRCGTDLLSPCLMFDPLYYKKTYPEVERCAEGAWAEFVTKGEAERKCPSIQFENWYDVAWFPDQRLRFNEEANGILYISLAKKMPTFFSQNPVLDIEFLLEKTNRDLPISNKLRSLAEKLDTNENIRPSAWFDPHYYRQRYLNYDNVSSLKHYIDHGVYQAYYPNYDVENLSKKPLISILMPVYNVKEWYLNRCIRSVLYQSYPHWELCIADDASPSGAVRDVLVQWREKDSRIKVVFLQENQGISGATNAAAEIAGGEYLAFLDNDDELHPEALFEVVKSINETQAEVIYTDEQLIDHDGRVDHVFHKPGFNRELLYSHNYITHFVVAKQNLYKQVEGLDSKKNGAQDFDFLLKVTEQTSQIEHIARSLYSWRATETSTTINHESKSYADEAGKDALESALARRGISGMVAGADWKFYYRVKREITSNIAIIVVVDARSCDSMELIKSVDRLCNDSMITEIVIVSDSQLSFILGPKCRVVEITEEQNIACLYNEIIKSTCGEQLLFVDSGLLPENDDQEWITCLLEHSQEQAKGVISGRIIAKKYRVNQIPDITRQESSYFAEYLQMCSVHMNGLQWSQEVLAANFDYCMVKKELFEKVNGFDEKYTSLKFAGIDLALRLQHLDVSNIYSSSASVVESQEYEKKLKFSENMLDMHSLKQSHDIGSMLVPQFLNPNLLEEKGIKLGDFYDWCC